MYQQNYQLLVVSPWLKVEADSASNANLTTKPNSTFQSLVVLPAISCSVLRLLEAVVPVPAELPAVSGVTLVEG